MPSISDHILRFLLVTLALGTAGVGAIDASEHDEFGDRAKSLLRAALIEHRLPSLSVAVASTDAILFAGAMGLADLENSVPATEKTVYRLGSVAKTITATAALSLAEQGQIDLDAAARHYCQAFPEKPSLVTVRQLLAHLGGIRHYDYRRFDEDFLNTERFPTLGAALSKFAADPLIAEPGTKYHYSSWGYVLVGCALEGASGTEYAELLRTTILEPASMDQTSPDVAATLVPHRARGYSRGADGSWHNAVPFDASDRYPAGGLQGTPRDLVKFATDLLRGDLVTEASRRQMWSLQRTRSGNSTGAGLGWSLSADANEVYHGGTTVGGTAYLYVRPADGIAVAFATNLSLWTEGRHTLAQALADAVRPVPPPE